MNFYSADVCVCVCVCVCVSVGAVGYYESSALTQTGLGDAMMATIRAGISGSESRGGTGRNRRLFRWPWR